MSKSKKSKTNRYLCSAEQAITAANWDKHSTWEALSGKVNIRLWPEGKLSGVKKSKSSKEFIENPS